MSSWTRAGFVFEYAGGGSRIQVRVLESRLLATRADCREFVRQLQVAPPLEVDLEPGLFDGDCLINVGPEDRLEFRRPDSHP